MTILLLNVLLFGSLYALAKAFEKVSWFIICNYDEIEKKVLHP